jgi:hypothetical protein
MTILNDLGEYTSVEEVDKMIGGMLEFAGKEYFTIGFDKYYKE